MIYIAKQDLSYKDCRFIYEPIKKGMVFMVHDINRIYITLSTPKPVIISTYEWLNFPRLITIQIGRRQVLKYFYVVEPEEAEFYLDLLKYDMI